MSMFNELVNAHVTPTYPDAASPQVVIPFEPKRIQLILEDTADSAFVSLDGVNDHVHLIPGLGPVVLEQRVTKLWLRVPAGADPVDIQVIAES